MTARHHGRETPAVEPEGRLAVHGPAGCEGGAWALTGGRWAWTARTPDGHQLGHGVAPTRGDAVHDALDTMTTWRDHHPERA